MPNIKSAIKRVKTSEAKNLQNRMKKSELRTTLRKYREAIEAKSPEAQDILKEAIKRLIRLLPRIFFIRIPPPERNLSFKRLLMQCLQNRIN